MPTYEYRCLACEKEYAIEARMSDPSPLKGPDCHGEDCRLEKRMSRVMGFVRGKAMAPAPAPQRAAASAVETKDPVHVCAKYCDHHAKV